MLVIASADNFQGRPNKTAMELMYVSSLTIKFPERAFPDSPKWKCLDCLSSVGHCVPTPETTVKPDLPILLLTRFKFLSVTIV